MGKKSGLGRGLESLLGETAGEVKEASDSPREIVLDDIETNPDQPRKTFGPEELSELADSIRQNGVLQPILLRPYGRGYQIVAGERRYQAARMAGLASIPAVVRDLDDEKALQIAMIENLQREDLNAMEEARGYRMLMDRGGLTQRQLAEILSKSRSAVANTLRLMDLPEEVQELVSQGLLSAGHARAILSLDDEQAKIELARRVVSEGLSVRQTETLASLLSGRKERPAKKSVQQPESYKRAAHRLCDVLGTKVSVRSARGKSRIEIEFEDEEQLGAIVEQLSHSVAFQNEEGA